MGFQTVIEWTHIFGPKQSATWNPIVAVDRKTGYHGWACVMINEACTRCYAQSMNVSRPYKYGTGLPYNPRSLAEIDFVLSEKGQSAITWPIRLKKNLGIFVCSMTDWLGEFLPPRYSSMLFTTMMESPQHVFFTLTKRYWAMSTFIARTNKLYAIPKNIWFGVTIANQKQKEEALPILLDIHRIYPDVNLWISYEPALGPVDWTGFEFVKWIVAGFESDNVKRDNDSLPARPGRPEWGIATKEFCEKNGIAFFWKQNGEWAHESEINTMDAFKRKTVLAHNFKNFKWDDGTYSYKVGKNNSGHTLLGGVYQYFPEVTYYDFLQKKETTLKGGQHSPARTEANQPAISETPAWFGRNDPLYDPEQKE